MIKIICAILVLVVAFTATGCKNASLPTPTAPPATAPVSLVTETPIVSETPIASEIPKEDMPRNYENLSIKERIEGYAAFDDGRYKNFTYLESKADLEPYEMSFDDARLHFANVLTEIMKCMLGDSVKCDIGEADDAYLCVRNGIAQYNMSSIDLSFTTQDGEVLTAFCGMRFDAQTGLVYSLSFNLDDLLKHVSETDLPKLLDTYITMFDCTADEGYYYEKSRLRCDLVRSLLNDDDVIFQAVLHTNNEGMLNFGVNLNVPTENSIPIVALSPVPEMKSNYVSAASENQLKNAKYDEQAALNRVHGEIEKLINAGVIPQIDALSEYTAVSDGLALVEFGTEGDMQTHWYITLTNAQGNVLYAQINSADGKLHYFGTNIFGKQEQLTQKAQEYASYLKISVGKYGNEFVYEELEAYYRSTDNGAKICAASRSDGYTCFCVSYKTL